MSAEVHEKLQKLKGLLANKMPEATYAELLEYMVDETTRVVEERLGVKHETETLEDPSHLSLRNVVSGASPL